MNRKSLLFAAMLLSAAALMSQGCQKSAEGTSAEASADTTEPVTELLYNAIITAEVEDPVKWEEGFRTHESLFRSVGTASPILMGISGNHVAVFQRVPDVDEFRANLQSEQTVAAMAADGVKRDTVRVFVLDREFVF